MAEELKAGCARPTGSVVGEPPANQDTYQEQEKEEPEMILIGRKAPDFTAPGYHQGKFVNIKLSEYLGKWILLCFYPGDFTFV
jgi:peroxiredoxin (alkyl hydroperoxide reductase subunit C)